MKKITTMTLYTGWRRYLSYPWWLLQWRWLVTGKKPLNIVATLVVDVPDEQPLAAYATGAAVDTLDVVERLIRAGWEVSACRWRDGFEWRSPGGLSGSEYVSDRLRCVPPTVMAHALRNGDIADEAETVGR